MSAAVELVVIGAGNRGRSYGQYALQRPERARVVAVADPDPGRRERFAEEHGLPSGRSFARWEDMFAGPRLAQAALVCTPDALHAGPATAALTLGYDVLVEKPMAPALEDCVALVRAAERSGRILQVAHVLRYAPFFARLHEIVASGELGEIVSVEHRENVAYWHMAHSFVRGNWRRRALSSPMLLAKCCHDLDLLVWNLGRPCLRLSSFGSLIHFRVDAAPTAVPPRCTDGCPIEPECPFSALAIYVEQRPFRAPHRERPRADGWPMSVVSADIAPEALREALATGPYGRCVYHSDNDVVDQQVVTMEIEGGVVATLVMHGHSHEDFRSLRYDGTRGTLRGRFGSRDEMTVHDHASGAERVVPLEVPANGHGGGDHGLMAAFVDAVRGEAPPLTSARASLESHLLAFAAESARESHTVVEMQAYRRRAEGLAAGGDVHAP